MRQRVVVAMALALEPALVFMDEPTTALDVVVQKEILDQISRLQASLGFAILLITHDLALMMSFCDRIGILYAGRLVESAPAEVLRDDARHPYTQGLMAASPDIARQDEVLYGLPGTPPDPRDPPTGCSFHPRCPAVMPRCRIERPPSRRLGPDHDCACWLYE